MNSPNPIARRAGLLAALCSGLFLALAGPPSARGVNLLVNGDFESGLIVPWGQSGNVQISNVFVLEGEHAVALNLDPMGAPTGSIFQTVATTVGAVYYVALDLASLSAAAGGDESIVTLSATSTTSMVPDEFRLILTKGQNEHYTMVFTATGANTTIQIDVSGAPTIVDDIQLIELPVSPLAGKYVGTEKTVISAEEAGVTAKAVTKVAGRVFPTGRFVLVEGTKEIAAGIILPDRTVDMQLHDKRVVVQATVKGSKITIVVSDSFVALDEGLNPVGGGLLTTIALTKTGR